MSLKRQVLRGTAWMGAASGLEQGLRLLRNLILARVLAPEAFGTMAIVLAAGSMFESFTEMGIKDAIIQSPQGKEARYLNGAWWMAALRGGVIYTIIFSGAPYVADFYGNVEISALMRVAFLSIVFKGLMSGKSYVALKEMRYGQWAVIFQGGAAVGILSSLGLAFVLRDVWALVIGYVLESVFRLALSHLVCPHRPTLDFDRDSLSALFKYSRGMVGLPILTFVFMRVDVFVVGKLQPLAVLGLYSMATGLARVPFQFLSSLVSQVMAPAFSKVQGDNDRANRGMIEVLSLLTIVGLPGLAFVVCFGQDVLGLVYGPRYASMAIPFAIIFAAEMLRVQSVPIASVYLMSGHPEFHRLFTGVRVLVIVALIYPAVMLYGPVGAAAACLVAVFVGHVLQLRQIRVFTGFQLSKYVAVNVGAVALCVPVVVAWILIRNVPAAASEFRLASGIAACFIGYAGAFVFLARSNRSTTAGRIFQSIVGKFA